MSDLSAIKLNGTTYTLSDDYARDSMAKIEYGTLATKAYAVGDFLINNNHLYKVTSAIAIGVKFTVGTNIELVKLSDEVKLKAPLASPTFTGTPKVPTASTGTKTTQIASTAYVQNEIDIVNNNVQSTIDYVQNELGGVLTSLRGDLNLLDSEVDTISDDVDSLDSAVDILTRQGTTLRNDGIVVCNAVDGGDNVFFMIDDTLTEAHKAADAKATGDAISSLNEDIANIDEQFNNLFVLQEGINLFNKNGEIISGKMININSTPGALDNQAATSVQYIPFAGVGTYSLLYPRNYYGSNIKICLYDSEKNYIRTVTGTSDAQSNIVSPAHFTISADKAADVAFIGFCYFVSTVDEAMVVKSETYPSEYIAYVDPYYVINGSVDASNVVNLQQAIALNLQSTLQPITSNISALQTKVNGNISAEDVNFISVGEAGANLFNKNGSIEENKAISPSTGALSNATGYNVQFIPFEGAGSYSCLYPQNYYGQSNIKLCLYDSDKNYLRTVSGTKTVAENNPHPCNFTISDANAANVEYIGYCYYATTADTAMFVKASTYPESYIPYTEPQTALSSDIKIQSESIPQADINPLYMKTVVFDGDSICKANGTTGGWAYIIGEGNSMDWHNVGVAGGTIAAETYSGDSSARHWVSRYIDTIHTHYSRLDYLIFEGGTNDADILTDAQIGVIDPAEWSTFDDTTFVGALESLFYKAINYYPTAKIGFIIAQKMGVGTGARYDAGDSQYTRKRRKFFELVIDVCKKWGIPYIDLWTGSPLCPKLQCYYDPSMTAEENTAAGKAYIDGQHLTQVGYDIISPTIEAWMKTL